MCEQYAYVAGECTYVVTDNKDTLDILTLVMLNNLMPHPFLIVSQSDDLIQVVDTYSYTK